MKQSVIDAITDIKNMILVFVSIMMIAFAFAAYYNVAKADACEKYINRLQEDYPDYIDTSVSGDEYLEYSQYH